MDNYIEEGFSLLAILLLLPVMLFIVLPATFLFDEHVGLFRRQRM